MIIKYHQGPHLRIPAKEVEAWLRKVQRDSGRLTPELVVAAAKSDPTMRNFLPDEAALIRNALMQWARKIMQSLIEEDDTGNQYRLYSSVIAGQSRQYERTREALKKPALRTQLLDGARREANSYAMKYGALKEVAGIVREVKKFLKDHPKETP